MKSNRMLWMTFCVVVSCGNAANITQIETLRNHLFAGYSSKLLPILDYDSQVTVAVGVGIVSINKFDELSGEIVITMTFYLVWKDERLNWNPTEYGGTQSLLVPPEDVWRPQLYLIESFDKIQEIGNISLWTRLFYSGVIQWNPGNVLKIVCSVDVTYFPFDRQECTLTVSGWVYTSDEVCLYSVNETLNNQFLSSNSQWKYVSGAVRNYTIGEGYPPAIRIVITLKRRSDFFVVYIIIPIVFLGQINGLVFVMPASSGERASVAITAFLSFVLYMEMVNSNVPESSDPIAYMYIYLLFLMVYSSLIMFLCILSLRIHDREDQVSENVKSVVRYLRFWCSVYRKSPKTKPALSRTASVVENDKLNNLNSKDVREVNGNVSEPTITWKVVGKTFDRYCCFFLVFTFWIFSTITFTNLYYNRGY